MAVVRKMRQRGINIIGLGTNTFSLHTCNKMSLSHITISSLQLCICIQVYFKCILDVFACILYVFYMYFAYVLYVFNKITSIITILAQV